MINWEPILLGALTLVGVVIVYLQTRLNKPPKVQELHDLLRFRNDLKAAGDSTHLVVNAYYLRQLREVYVDSEARRAFNAMILLFIVSMVLVVTVAYSNFIPDFVRWMYVVIAVAATALGVWAYNRSHKAASTKTWDSVAALEDQSLEQFASLHELPEEEE